MDMNKSLVRLFVNCVQHIIFGKVTLDRIVCLTRDVSYRNYN